MSGEREHLDARTYPELEEPAESTLTRVELTPHDMMTLPAAEIRARQQLLADVTTHGDSVRVWFCVECRWTGNAGEAPGDRCPRCEASGLHWARVRALEASVLGFR